MRTALVIGSKDLRQRLRDRSAIVVAFVAPIGLATIISLAFGSNELSFRATWALVDADGTQLTRAFDEQVLRSDGLRETVTVVRAGEAEARAMVRRGEASAAFVFPPGFEDALLRGVEARFTVLGHTGDVGATVARSVAESFADRVDAIRLSVAAAIASGADPLSASALAQRAAAVQPSLSLVDGPIGDREVSGISYFGPAMAIFFVFFTVGWGSRSLLTERREGTLARLLAAPAGRGAVLAGKTAAAFVLGLASMGTMFASMRFAFGAELGDPLALAALTIFTVVAVIALTGLVATFAKTDEQADSLSSMAAVTLALVGGNFFPLHQLPEAIQRASLVTPNGWAIRGFTDVVYDGAGLVAILPHLGAIAGFAAVTGLIAIRRSGRITT